MVIKLPVDKRTNMVLTIKRFIKILLNIFLGLFFSKKVGYKIDELNRRVLWFCNFDPFFCENIGKYKKRTIEIRKFNGDKIIKEYDATYIIVNWFFVFYFTDSEFLEYEKNIEQNGSNSVGFAKFLQKTI